MRAKSVKRFERSNGLDTAIYKNYLYLYIVQNVLKRWVVFDLLLNSGFEMKKSILE